jgi:hypothetical protein
VAQRQHSRRQHSTHPQHAMNSCGQSGAQLMLQRHACRCVRCELTYFNDLYLKTCQHHHAVNNCWLALLPTIPLCLLVFTAPQGGRATPLLTH